MAEENLTILEKLRRDAEVDAKKNGVQPCPFCGSMAVQGAVNMHAPVEGEAEGDNWWSQVLTLTLANDDVDGKFRLWCMACQITGPIASRMALAVVAWNRRFAKICGCGRALSVVETCSVCDRDE